MHLINHVAVETPVGVVRLMITVGVQEGEPNNGSKTSELLCVINSSLFNGCRLEKKALDRKRWPCSCTCRHLPEELKL